jgi:hypothetical protein
MLLFEDVKQLPSHITMSVPLISQLRRRSGWWFLVGGLAVCFAACGGPEGPGNPKVPAGAKSSGGKHAVIDTDRGAIELELLETPTLAQLGLALRELWRLPGLLGVSVGQLVPAHAASDPTALTRFVEALTPPADA